VRQVWDEFHVGSPGRAPLCRLIATQGPTGSWRDERYISKHVFNDRLAVVDAVVHLGQRAIITNTNAALWLDAYQSYKKMHVSGLKKVLWALKGQAQREGKGWGDLIYTLVNIPVVVEGLIVSGGRTQKDVTEVRTCAEVLL